MNVCPPSHIHMVKTIFTEVIVPRSNSGIENISAIVHIAQLCLSFFHLSPSFPFGRHPLYNISGAIYISAYFLSNKIVVEFHFFISFRSIICSLVFFPITIVHVFVSVYFGGYPPLNYHLRNYPPLSSFYF